jgi:hypothetical protein
MMATVLENGLDFFGAIYYSSVQARYTTVDSYNPLIDGNKESIAVGSLFLG